MKVSNHIGYRDYFTKHYDEKAQKTMNCIKYNLNGADKTEMMQM